MLQKAKLTLNTSASSSNSHLSTICTNSWNGISQVCKLKRVCEQRHDQQLVWVMHTYQKEQIS